MREFRVSSTPQKSHDFGGYAREFGHLISRGQIGNKDVKKANKTKMRILPQNLIKMSAKMSTKMGMKMSMKMDMKMSTKMTNNNDI